MKYAWTAKSNDGTFEDKSEKTFDTQDECYMDMMNHAVNKMKWNVEYTDVTEGVCLIEGEDGLTRTNDNEKEGSCYYIGYEVKFMPHKIVHTSYSGTYTYEIVTVADEGEKPGEKREESTRNKYSMLDESKYSMLDEVEYHGMPYLVKDYRYDEDAGRWVYDLTDPKGDGEATDIPQDELKAHIEGDLPESIIAEYEIDGKRRMYVYNLTDINDCEHFFDDEDCLVRTLVKTDKGLSEEDYYRDVPIVVVKKWVLAARQKLG